MDAQLWIFVPHQAPAKDLDRHPGFQLLMTTWKVKGRQY
jgi:hypothetical protein